MGGLLLAMLDAFIAITASLLFVYSRSGAEHGKGALWMTRTMTITPVKYLVTP